MVNLRPATAADIEKMYGKRHQYTMRAVVATIDDEVVGIAGVFYNGRKLCAFSEMLPEMRAYPFAIYKAARLVKDMIIRTNAPVIAVANGSVAGAEDLLYHLGFDHIDTCPEGEVYQWTPE